MTKVSIAIPTYCRAEMLIQSFSQVLGDERVGEVVITDDCSPDGSFQKVCAWADGNPKVRVYRNERNLDCYRNKREAVAMATSKWVILFDDDNVLGPDYLDTLYAQAPWDPRVLYCPDWAKPAFNYTALAGVRVDRRNVAGMMKREHFATALNTANYLVHRETFLGVWDGTVDPVTADSMFHAYNHLAAGGAVLIVPGLRYEHRIHDGSHYKKNVHRTGNFADVVEQKLKSLK